MKNLWTITYWLQIFHKNSVPASFHLFVLPVPSGTIGTNLILAWSYKSLFLSFQSWINISFLRWTITSCPINSPFILTLTIIPAFCIISRLAKRIKRKIKEREQKRDGKSSVLPQANAKFFDPFKGVTFKTGPTRYWTTSSSERIGIWLPEWTSWCRVFLAGRMNRTQIFNLHQNRDHIYAKIRYHQAIGALDKENLTWLPVSPLGWLRGTSLF